MKRKTDLEFQKELATCTDGFIQSLEPYNGAKTPILFKCEKGHVFKSTPDNLWHNNRAGNCERCSNIALKKRDIITNGKRFTNDVKFLTNNQYTVISYRGAKHVAKLKCPNGHVFTITPSNFRLGYRCRYCIKSQKAS